MVTKTKIGLAAIGLSLEITSGAEESLLSSNKLFWIDKFSILIEKYKNIFCDIFCKLEKETEYKDFNISAHSMNLSLNMKY